MRRLARRLFAVFSALALLLSVATCVLWVRSRSGTDTALWTYYRSAADGTGDARGTWSQFVSDDGRLSISGGSSRAGPPRPELSVGIHINVHESGGRPRLDLHHRRHDVSDWWNLEGRRTAPGTPGLGPLRWERSSRFDPGIPMWQRSASVHVPHWLAAAVLAAPAALALVLRIVRRRRRSLRAGRGLCPSCGYDLRASTGRCPECGTAVVAPAVVVD